jgi:prolyl-tRNA synthetase
VHLVLIGPPGSEQARLADRLFAELTEVGLDVLYDDRPAVKPGEKFVEAELLGCPLRLTIGKRTLPDGPIEAQVRAGRRTEQVPLEGAAAAVRALWESLP